MHDRHMHPGQDTASRRSANMTLDKLDEALSNLERRMGIDSAGRTTRPPMHRDDDISAIRARQEALARRDDYAAQRRPAPREPHQPTPRGSSDLRADLAVLREELNREMTTTIAEQFAGIREELKGLYRQAGSVTPEDLADGFSRVSRELGIVASRVENNDMGSLRAEVDELKSHVVALAREDSLRDMSERWSVIEREIGALPQLLGTREDLNAVSDRIAELGEALHALPDTQANAAMEQQMRSLAEAVESLASQNAAVTPDHLEAIELRLDEITRAIVSVSVSAVPPTFDTEPFERIEARLTTLARQVEEQNGAQQADKVEQRLAEIAARLDALHESTAAGSMPDKAFEAVALRLDDIARRVDIVPGESAGMSAGMMDSLDARFEDLARRLDSAHHSAEEQGRKMFQSLDQRMEDLARRIDENERDASAIPTFDHMERRIEEIAQMLTAGDGLSPVASQQPETQVLESLEAQIAALSEKLSSVIDAPASQASVADLAPRLAAISEQLASGREEMFSVAREAAEEVVARFSDGASVEQKTMLAQLAGDLRALEELSRNSDDRNSRTFEAIHDTLVKVADRIAGLESNLRTGSRAADIAPPAAPARADLASEDKPSSGAVPSDLASTPVAPPARADVPETKTHIEDAPPVDFAAGEEQRPKEQARRVTRQGVSPAEAAALAARAAIDKQATPEEDAEVIAGPAAAGQPEARGFLSGLRSAILRNGRDDGGDEPEDDGEPTVFGKGGKGARVELVDEPLEPGSGAPDLAEIMKRVRAERAGPAADAAEDPADDAGKSDFIAAARRAARAAADDASVAEKKGGRTVPGAAGTKGFLASRRRPLMVAAGAILLALMAFPLARGYLFDRGGTPAEIAETGNAETAAVTQELPDEQIASGEATAEQTVDTMRVVDAPAPDVASAAPVAVEAEPAAEIAVAEEDAGAVEMAETAAMPADDGSEADGGFVELTLDDIPAEIGPVALREAAVEGDPMALFVIGERLTDGDLEAAARWYEMSAEAGYAPAQYRIGNAYEKGMGVERDIAAAKTWYELAAEQGNVSAMHNLAVLHATEIDGVRDMEEAARWFLEAADHGVTDSQVNLGILAARGEGMPQDLAESWKWLSLAANAGDKDAGAKRDEVAGFMRPDQLETARAAVELWKVQPVETAVNAVDVPQEWTTGEEMTASAPVSSEAMTKAVRNIQAILNNNGFDAGPADGVMGARTRNAIIEFQKANGLLPTGEVDRALVDKLLEVNQQS